ncbi:exodeoxyribonuclease V subunit gamma [Chitinimonas koreensis]|uniref:exodeoxyribonuclease V subunit gamma n=1 Tax=Chitinimonas koreensis TaxID=356302 RepID=UPI00040603E6|nr:exodeoxyribonuclease V subunit gamma [Chitinimonas koreensis]QNM96507.1 exodeoxyribonuclease V subunit gamma [Chitinimonas koreensis]
MLHLYQSNRLETLAALLDGVLAQPPADPYARETVIVQARGMGRWLALALAERFGVCANVDFPLPATFLWRLIEQVLGPQSRKGPFGADALAWRLHALLADPPPALAGYLARPPGQVAAVAERRRWRLARRIADVFDHYLVYRPDWLEAWEAGQLRNLGRDEDWQAQLWRRLAADRDGPHRADLMRELLARLADAAPLDLPERIVLFGSSSLPPLMLDVLRALSRRIDVCLFALNPCAAPWGDLTRKAQTLAPGERLLAAWGAQGRVFFDELAGADELTSLFDDSAPDHLLGALQHAVLTLEPVRFTADDSLAIHACHGPQRQVETLKDALLARFAADPTLQPDQVVVLCPDVEGYAPHIEAVFGHGEPAVPFAVADRGGLAASPLLAGFVALLRLPDSDWEAGRIAALLEIPALAARFGLAEADLPLLREWIARGGIRRGRSGDEFSWEAGIGRLLLGVALPRRLPVDPAAAGAESSLPLFGALLPADGLDLRFADRVAALARVVRQLGRWQDALAHERPPAEWSGFLLQWIDGWFADPGHEAADQAALDRLRGALVELAELAEHAGVTAPVGRAAVVEWLEGRLGDGSSAGGFLTGGVTFAQLMPMRNLPFRVVAVLGLDDGAFPRDSQPDGFDLIARHPRRGDRARALDERWLFLETVLAARDALLLFYTGRDARSDVALPPSTVIADLVDTLGEAGPALLHQHPLQAFSPDRFGGRAALPAFDARWAGIARQAGRGDQPAAPLDGADWAIAQPATLELDELLAFAGDPAGWFLRRQGVRFERAEAELAAREPFALQRQDERALLELAERHAGEPAALAALGHAAAVLPMGATGALWAEREAARFAPALAAWRERPERSLSIDLELDHLRLGGLLRGIGADGLQLQQPGPLWDSARLAAWLQHLLLCIAQPAGIACATRLVGLDEVAHYRAPADARALLRPWLAAWRDAHQRPPPLLPRCALAWLKGRDGKGGSLDKAWAEALKAWLGSEQAAGEGARDAVRALWRDQPPLGEAFAALADTLIAPMLAHETLTELPA